MNFQNNETPVSLRLEAHGIDKCSNKEMNLKNNQSNHNAIFVEQATFGCKPTHLLGAGRRLTQKIKAENQLPEHQPKVLPFRAKHQPQISKVPRRQPVLSSLCVARAVELTVCSKLDSRLTPSLLRSTSSPLGQKAFAGFALAAQAALGITPPAQAPIEFTVATASGLRSLTQLNHPAKQVEVTSKPSSRKLDKPNKRKFAPRPFAGLALAAQAALGEPHPVSSKLVVGPMLTAHSNLKGQQPKAAAKPQNTSSIVGLLGKSEQSSGQLVAKKPQAAEPLLPLGTNSAKSSTNQITGFNHSIPAEKIINQLMRDGKKTKASQIFYKTLALITDKILQENSVEVLASHSGLAAKAKPTGSIRSRPFWFVKTKKGLLNGAAALLASSAKQPFLLRSKPFSVTKNLYSRQNYRSEVKLQFQSNLLSDKSRKACLANNQIVNLTAIRKNIEFGGGFTPNAACAASAKPAKAFWPKGLLVERSKLGVSRLSSFEQTVNSTALAMLAKLSKRSQHKLDDLWSKEQEGRQRVLSNLRLLLPLDCEASTNSPVHRSRSSLCVARVNPPSKSTDIDRINLSDKRLLLALATSYNVGCFVSRTQPKYCNMLQLDYLLRTTQVNPTKVGYRATSLSQMGFSGTHLKRRLQVSDFSVLPGFFADKAKFSNSRFSREIQIGLNSKLHESPSSCEASGTEVRLLAGGACFAARAQQANHHSRQALDLIASAIYNVKPSLDVRQVRIAGMTYQVPNILDQKKSINQGVRWIIEAARLRQSRTKNTISRCLADEFLDAFQKQGKARQKRDHFHNLALTNRAYVRFRWW